MASFSLLIPPKSVRRATSRLIRPISLPLVLPFRSRMGKSQHIRFCIEGSVGARNTLLMDWRNRECGEGGRERGDRRGGERNVLRYWEKKCIYSYIILFGEREIFFLGGRAYHFMLLFSPSASSPFIPTFQKTISKLRVRLLPQGRVQSTVRGSPGRFLLYRLAKLPWRCYLGIDLFRGV